MDFGELPGLFAKYRDLSAAAAPAVVKGMADTYYDQVERNLRFRAHPPGYFSPPRSWTNAPRGEPPALVTGRLAGSVTVRRGFTTGMFAQASVAPHTIYASVQEYGRDIYAKHKRFMHWRDSGGSHFAKMVRIPERPYMRPALEHVIITGSLSRSAMDAFKASMAGLAG